MEIDPESRACEDGRTGHTSIAARWRFSSYWLSWLVLDPVSRVFKTAHGASFVKHISLFIATLECTDLSRR